MASPFLLEEHIALVRARNAREVIPFEGLVKANEQLFLRCKSIEQRNSELMRQMANAKHIDLASSTTDSGSGKVGTGQVLTLQRKIAALQEELSSLYKGEASTATRHLNLTLESSEFQKKVNLLQKKIQELERECAQSKKREKQKDELVKTLYHEIEVLQGELLRVRKLLEKAEEENRTLHKDNRQLVKQTIEEKTRLMEELNRMNQLVEESKQNSEPLVATSHEEGDNAVPPATPTPSCALPTAPFHAIKAHATEINGFVYSSSNSMLLSASSDSTIRIWDATTFQARAELKGGGQPIMCVDINDNGDLVAGSSIDRVCRIWSVSTCRVRHNLTGHAGKVYAVKFTFDGRSLLTGGTDRTVKLWDVNTGYCVKTAPCKSTCNGIAVSFGKQAVTAHQDGVIRFWDARTPSSAHQTQDLMISQGHQVTSVAFSRDGNYVLTNSRDNILRLLDVRSLSIVQTFSDPNYRTGFNWAKASLSPDSKFVVAGSGDGALFIWNSLSGTVEKSLEKHTGAVSCAAWNQNGSFVASCDKNGYLILWK